MRLALVWALALSGCGDDEAATQVMVHVQADPVVAAAGGTLAITVQGGESLASLARAGEERVPASYPHVVAIAPRGNDASRAWGVEVTLEGASVGALARAARGGFAEGRVVRYDLLLAADCAGVTCAGDETCAAAACVERVIDVGALPDYAGPGEGVVDAGVGVDAGEPDAGGVDAGGVDAGGMDAGGMDAGGMDAGGMDAGEPDAGEPDAGEPDAGPPPDAGPAPDAGPPCGLACTPEPCFDGTVVCDPDAHCERSAVFRASGACGAGRCTAGGVCAVGGAVIHPPPGPPEFGADEEFGSWLDLSGARLVVGVPDATVGSDARAGRALVMLRGVDGTWAVERELAPIVARAADDDFGRGVAIDGDRLVAGFRGGMQVYQRDATRGWEPTAFVSAGAGVTLVGPIALERDYLVAASTEGIRVWERTGGSWSSETLTGASCGIVSDVALSGNLAVAGCHRSDRAQVWGRTAGGAWTLRATLTGAAFSDFGTGVDILESARPTLAISERGDGVTSDGRVHVYRMGPSPTVWIPDAVVAPRDISPGDDARFGFELELLDDRRFAASAPGAAVGGLFAGAVYVFERDGFGALVETLRATTTPPRDGDFFGRALATDGDTVVASGLAAGAGEVWVFDLAEP